MEPLTVPQHGAVYFKIRLQYKRSYDDKILETTGVLRNVARSFLIPCLDARNKRQYPRKVLKGGFTSTDFPLSDRSCYIRLCEAHFSEHVSGVLMVLEATALPPTLKIDEFDYFALTILSQEYAARKPQNLLHKQYQTCIPEIIKLFEDHLLSRHPQEDRWNTGSDVFKKTLAYFVDRALPVQFCLPAFPCKSTNWRKTSSRLPDGAEHEAFLHLHLFCIKLQAIYPPGAHFFIVSDGHVFSDCIGTHDQDVYEYTDEAKALCDKIYSLLQTSAVCYIPEHAINTKAVLTDFQTSASESPIRFFNLHNIFQPDSEILRSIEADWDHVKINHPINTDVLPADDKCRGLMMRSCGFDEGMLGKMIKNYPEHSLTKTYAGFIRFMEEDLEDFDEMKQQQTITQRKRIARRVAEEMIQRNQAYSHLVELVHPKAIRCSIHQHKNHGPKFAVNLLPPARFRSINSLDAAALQTATAVDNAENSKVQEAHIPTPWHNVLVEIGEYAIDRNPVEDDGGPAIVYVCKSGIVLDAKETFESRYVQEHSRGARWCLKRRA